MANTIRDILLFLDRTATTVCDEIDKVVYCHREVRQALKELRKRVESLKSDSMVYKVLLTRFHDAFFFLLYTNNDESHAYTRCIRLLGGEGALVDLEKVLEATRTLLQDVYHKATIYLSWSDIPLIHDHELIDLKDTTDKIFVCQQDNERAFKLVWYRFVTAQQRGRSYFVDKIGSSQDKVGLTLDCILHAFHIDPFAISPKKDSLSDLHTISILNHNRETATQHEELVRQFGKAWVDVRVRKHNAQVRDIGALQTTLFGLLWSGTVEELKRHSPYSSDDPERPEFEKVVEELERSLRDTIVRPRNQHITIAFCGTVQAGKSSFLNALMGRSILPSDELPSKACPCRIRHVQGHTVPKLQYQVEPFITALKRLQANPYGRVTYQPPHWENMFEALLSDALSKPSDEGISLRNSRLPRMATGEQNVKILLGHLNDIVRLCQRFDLKFEMSEVDWPLLTVEFNSLRDLQMDSVYEFIDLPDIGGDFFEFNLAPVVRRMASDSNAVVPIVSFKELHRSDWKRLPALIASGFNGRASTVVCTHLDQVSQENMDEQLKTVANTFWPRGVLNTNRVIPCSSLMGLSARDLLDRSSMTKPPFETIWNKDVVGCYCATKILGVRDPRANYGQFDIQRWRDRLHTELRASGLPGVIQRLTDSARVTALLSEADTVIRLLQEMTTVYGRKLSEERRIKTEYDIAKRSYDQAVEISQAVLDTWGRVESMQTQEVRLLLEQELGMISQKACKLINQTIKKTLTDCGLSLEDMDAGHGTRSASSGKRRFSGVQLGHRDTSDKSQEPSAAETGHSNVLITEAKSRTKEFLRLSQSELSSALETLKREYTAIILDLDGTAQAKLLKVVRGMIKQVELQPLPEDWENRVGDLERPSLNIDGFAFQKIRGVINSRQLTLFNREYSIEIDTLHDRFMNETIDPWIRKLKEEGEKALLIATETRLKAAKDLMTSALLEKENRCKRELAEKEKPIDKERVEHLTTVYSNLLAAETASKEFLLRAEALQI